MANLVTKQLTAVLVDNIFDRHWMKCFAFPNRMDSDIPRPYGWIGKKTKEMAFPPTKPEKWMNFDKSKMNKTFLNQFKKTQSKNSTQKAQVGETVLNIFDNLFTKAKTLWSFYKENFDGEINDPLTVFLAFAIIE